MDYTRIRDNPKLLEDSARRFLPPPHGGPGHSAATSPPHKGTGSGPGTQLPYQCRTGCGYQVQERDLYGGYCCECCRKHSTGIPCLYLHGPRCERVMAQEGAELAPLGYNLRPHGDAADTPWWTKDTKLPPGARLILDRLPLPLGATMVHLLQLPDLCPPEISSIEALANWITIVLNRMRNAKELKVQHYGGGHHPAKAPPDFPLHSYWHTGDLLDGLYMLLLYFKDPSAALTSRAANVLEHYFQEHVAGTPYPIALNPGSRWPRRPADWERRLLQLPPFLGYPHQEAPDYDMRHTRVEFAGPHDQPAKKQRRLL